MEKDLPDEMLIKSFLEGNASDFNILYERYKRQLYSYLNRLIPGQHALVDDIFQQTWIKVIKQLHNYESRQKFLAWLMRIARNQAIDHFRWQKRHEVQELPDGNNEDFITDESRPWQNMDRKELEEAMNWALEQIAPELREVFILRQDGMSFKEIASVQDCSLNTALGRMQYAMKNLRKLLSEWHPGGN